MVNSDKGKAIHDVVGGYEDSPEVEVGLQDSGFSREEARDTTGYGIRERDYSHGNFGIFNPVDRAVDAFSELFDDQEDLERDRKVRTDGGREKAMPYGGSETYVGNLQNDETSMNEFPY